MYNTEQVDVIASVTELRMETVELIDALKNGTRFIGIQRNNEPVAVLMSWEMYRKLRPHLSAISA